MAGVQRSSCTGNVLRLEANTKVGQNHVFGSSCNADFDQIRWASFNDDRLQVGLYLAYGSHKTSPPPPPSCTHLTPWHICQRQGMACPPPTTTNTNMHTISPLAA